jgi:threonine synthase
MDVGNPSNFVRILEIFHHQFPELKNKLSSYSISDEDTVATIKEVYEQTNYLLDPHGAVGYLALEKYLTANPSAKGIFLETAHPVKFPDAVEKITRKKIELPLSIKDIMTQAKKSTKMKAEYIDLKNYLLG